MKIILFILGVITLMLVNYYSLENFNVFKTIMQVLLFNISSIFILYSEKIKFQPDKKYISLYFFIVSIPVLLWNYLNFSEYFNLFVYLIILVNIILLIVSFIKNKKPMEDKIKKQIFLIFLIIIFSILFFYLKLWLISIIYVAITYLILNKLINKKETYLLISYLSMSIAAFIILYLYDLKAFLIFAVMYVIIISITSFSKNGDKYDFKVSETTLQTGFGVIFLISEYNSEIKIIQDFLSKINL